MPGGLMQIVAKGAQDQLVNGNPSFTHFRSVYKRHTDFAMEHFRLYFKTSTLSIPPSGSLTLRTKVDRNAQLLHDCYLSFTLPSIWSPTYTSGANTTGYEFQWIRNIGYNMINYVAVLVNGQEIVKHSGEYLKLYAALNFNANKKAILDELVGNVKPIYDPANAWDRANQYPHAVSTSTKNAEPSISGRVLTIPFHFWFCEDVGSSLPLIALQHSEVEFVVELKNIYQLFTTLGVDPANTAAFRKRVAPDSSNPLYQITRFLSPPTYVLSGNSLPTNPTLTLWDSRAFIEANYIFLNDTELIHIAKTDHSFIIKQIDLVSTFGQHGPSNDLELGLRNLCTRVAWVCQRSDRALENDVDNYTNWENSYLPPLGGNNYNTSGTELNSNVSQRDILLESTIILDGKERFGAKQTEFFSLLQNYRHQDGRTVVDLPGIYTYSFALDHNTKQPSGHLNGSMFNKTILRNTYIEPPAATSPGVVRVCVLKDTANSPNPTIVNSLATDRFGKLLYTPNEIVNIIRKGDGQTFLYTYNVRAYIESYNFLRVLGGVANVVFSS